VIKYVDGDLIEMALDGKVDAIVHGCNCFCTMGAGIARQLADRFPEVAEADRNFSIAGDPFKLGRYTDAVVKNRAGKELTIINAYTQYDMSKSGERVLEYSALTAVLRTINTYVGLNRIGMPRIGCGLAGGDWNIVKSIIEQTMPRSKVTVVNYVKQRSDIIDFAGYKCVPMRGFYSNGRPALFLVDAEDKFMVAKASVNIPECVMDESCGMAIKTWSENQGILEALKDSGLLSGPVMTTRSGFVDVVPVFEVTQKYWSLEQA
jgi:O-acetyl-ADP-ribose deacetylase (regulator of RNase III)